MNIVKISIFVINQFLTIQLKNTLFEDYRIESLNNNEVAFEVQLDNLNRALKSAQHANDVHMKLSKNGRGTPIVAVIIESQVCFGYFFQFLLKLIYLGSHLK